MNNICYLVCEIGGDTGEYYEIPVKVFLNKSNADDFIKEKSKVITKESLLIDPSEYQEALEFAWDKFPESSYNDIPFPELIHMTGNYPNWSLEELSRTEEFIRREEKKWFGYITYNLELCQ